MIKTSKHSTNTQYGRWVTLAIATSALLLALGCVDRAEWGGKESDLLQNHRSELEHLAQMVMSWDSFGFVRVSSADVRVQGRVAERDFAALTISGLPGDERPVWEQPYDKLIDKKQSISLAQLLDSSGVPYDSFAVLCSFLEEQDIRGVIKMYTPEAVLFLVDNWEGIGYRPVANSELYGSYPDSMLVIDEHWFWFVTDLL